MSKFALLTPRVVKDERADGSILLRSETPLGPYLPQAAGAALQWAERDPDRLALADREGSPDTWRRLSYGEFAERTARLGQAFLNAGLGPDRPLLLISQNRIESALVLYAAYRAGVPISPVTPAYSAGQGDRSRLSAVIETLAPGMAIVDDFSVHRDALKATLAPGVPIISMTPSADTDTFASLLAAPPGDSFFAAEAAVQFDDIAKILFTSGSTGTPKGAINTHRMLSSNAQALLVGWPFLAEEAPVVVDWLPWNHTFGGNFVLNSVLSFGGALYIDDGKPLPGQIDRSVANSAEIGPTIHVNAPRGLEMVARVLSADAGLADAFFQRLGLVFFASAGLPPRLRGEWLKLIERHAKRPVAFVSSWGTTETAPMATALNFTADEINNIGTPAPGTSIKLAPMAGRYEIRAKGPNITPGYYKRPDLTEAAFDEEGYFRSGDAGVLADPDRPEAGVLIEGRLGEDFKLDTGVWVSVSGIRGQVLEIAGPIVRDIVISGPNRSDLTALVFLDPEQCAKITGVGGDCAAMAAHPKIEAAIRAAIEAYNAANTTSSRKLAGYAIMSRPVGSEAGELTEKGTVNQRAVLMREAALCEDLHARSKAPAI